MRQVDVYLLDWNGRRPRDVEGVWSAFNAGRYEYSFSLPMDPAVSPIAACEHAYMRQQDVGFKTRQDRQSMSTGDVVVLDGTAYYCATAGFKEVPGLATQIMSRLERSWNAWTDDGDAANSAREFERLLRRLATVDANESWRGNDDEIGFLRSTVDIARRALGLPEPSVASEPPIDALERVSRAEAAEARMSREWVVDPEEVDVPNPDLLASNGDTMRKAERGG